MKDGISIVVPVYHAAAFLAETIAYVQAQTWDDWELLLVDDCSEDGSMEIARAAAAQDARIIPIAQEQNAGAAAARNLGISRAQRRYLCFLDADDIWEPDKLAHELAFLKAQDAAFVFTGYEFADEAGRGLGKIVHVPAEITYSQALKNTTIFTSTVMIDREKVADEDIYMPWIASEDTATWWHILKTYGRGYGLDENLVRYRRTGGTLSSNKLVAIERIWRLYRKQERLGAVRSAYCMVCWAVRAVARRL